LPEIQSFSWVFRVFFSKFTLSKIEETGDIMKTEAKNLLSLIDDPDQQIYSAVKAQILERGEEILPFLSELHQNTNNALAQKRSEELLDLLKNTSLFSNFKDWLCSEEKDLLKAAYLIDLIFADHYDFNNLKNQINEIVEKLRPNINQSLTPLKKIKTINRYLYQRLLFTKCKDDDERLGSYSVSSVLEKKQASMFVMAIIYISVAKELGITLKGLPLPDNFTLAFISVNPTSGEEQVLFYINPNNRGAIFTQLEIDDYISRYHFDKKTDIYKPCHNEYLVFEMAKNAQKWLKKTGGGAQIESLQEIKNAIKEYVTEKN